MTTYRIIAHRSAASVFGAGEATAKLADGRPAEFPTRAEAEAQIKKWDTFRTPDSKVWNTIEEVETQPESESILAKLRRELGRPPTQAEVDAIIALARAKL